jgi:hypothetical protein
VDGDSLVFSAENLPTNAGFVDNFDGTGTFSFSPQLGQTGNYDVRFIVSDLTAADTELVTIQVIDFENQAPVFDPVPPDTVDEGDVLTLLLHAVDDADIPWFIVDTDIENYTFTDSGNGYAVFEYYPDYYEAGVDTVTFFAFDNYTPPLTSIIEVEITVLDANYPPLLHVADSVFVGAGDSVNIHIVATDSTDADGGRLYLFAPLKPTGSVFRDSTNGAGSLRWLPQMADTGQHVLALLCLDADTPAMSDRDTVFITV